VPTLQTSVVSLEVLDGNWYLEVQFDESRHFSGLHRHKTLVYYADKGSVTITVTIMAEKSQLNYSYIKLKPT